MLYVIALKDNNGVDAARQQHRDGHLAHFKAHKSNIALSGPLTSDNGEGVGSIVIYEAASEAEALAFIKGDPFYPANVWGDVTVAKFKASIFAAEKF